jgi:hypothetical protein
LAAQGNSMRPGETGHAVALLQGGLIAVGNKMPISTTRKHGAPDGIYGAETQRVVRKFQADQKLSPDGIAGRNTVTRLDALLPAAALPPKPPEPVPPPPAPSPPTSSDFKLGTDDPKITPDAGAGPWNSKPKEVLTAAQYLGILEALGPATVLIGDDAVKHMLHYLNNTGSPLTIDLEGMVAEVPSAKVLFDLEVAKIKAYAERLPPGAHDITSTHAVNGYNLQRESKNWFFAVGGYSVWTKGHATVTGTGSGHDVKLDLEYKFYDRYNWDGGKFVTIAGIRISDETMGEFHREGMAHEYDEVGSLRRPLAWKAP